MRLVRACMHPSARASVGASGLRWRRIRRRFHACWNRRGHRAPRFKAQASQAGSAPPVPAPAPVATTAPTHRRPTHIGLPPPGPSQAAALALQQPTAGSSGSELDLARLTPNAEVSFESRALPCLAFVRAVCRTTYVCRTWGGEVTNKGSGVFGQVWHGAAFVVCDETFEFRWSLDDILLARC